MTRPVTNKTFAIMVWLVSLSVSAILAGGFATKILPFTPYELQDYQIVPDTVCPGGEVRFEYRADVSKMPLATIHEGDPNQAGDEAIRTRAQWVQLTERPDGTLEVGKKLEPEVYPSDFNGRYGERTGTASFARYAPNEPGLWRQDITIFVGGVQALRSVTQIVPTFPTDPVTVRPFDAPACR